ncbi:hypothetical protein E8E11_000617 [Didymella keratinophila]|nr:hypothetical protein E8E11_000617 [Didymella keratinophila]
MPIGDASHHDAGDLSPGASKYFSDLYTLDAAQPSGAVARPRDQHTVPSSTGVRTTSVVTLFPRGVDYAQVPKEADTSQTKTSQEQDPAAQKESFFKKHYRRLKEIHDNGPPGETQTFLAGMNSYLKARKIIFEFELCSPRQKDEANSVVDGHNARTRQDSVVSYGNISCTSQEVPVKIQRTVLEMNITKPLPPLPPLDVTPMQRLRIEKGKMLNINKPLPRTPLYCSSISEKALEPVEDSPVDAPWGLLQSQTVDSTPLAKQPGSSQKVTTSFPRCVDRNSERTWLEDPTDISKFPVPPGRKLKLSKSEKAHDALKAKISHPIPITHTINNRFPELTPYTVETAEGKPKTPSSPTWLNKLAHPTLPTIPTMPAMPTFYRPKKRPASEESFACQGLRESNVYAEMVMGGGALSADQTSTETIDETVPVPLFSGRRSDGSYHKAGYAAAEQDRTGRWV